MLTTQMISCPAGSIRYGPACDASRLTGLAQCPLTSGLLRLLQPLGQDGLELAGILETELQVLKAADGGLAELGAMDSS